MAASASWISLYRWGVGASWRLRQVTRFAGGPFFPRREAAVVEPVFVALGCAVVVLGPAFVAAGCVAAVLEPAFVVAGCGAVVLETVAAFGTPVFEGAACFLVADAADFVTVFWGDVVFFAGVVLSALQPSAERAAMAAQHRIVRMLVVQFNAARGAAVSERSGACRPQTPGPTPRWDRALFAAPGM